MGLTTDQPRAVVEQLGDARASPAPVSWARTQRGWRLAAYPV